MQAGAAKEALQSFKITPTTAIKISFAKKWRLLFLCEVLHFFGINVNVMVINAFMVFILAKQTSLKGGYCSEQYHNQLERFWTREKLIRQGVFIKLKKKLTK